MLWFYDWYKEMKQENLQVFPVVYKTTKKIIHTKDHIQRPKENH